jgi:surface antigen
MNRRQLIFFATLLVAAGGAQAFNLAFLGDSVMQRITAQDAQLMSGALDAALAAPEEGNVRDWSNPESGANGAVTLRRIYQRHGRACRSLHIRTTAQSVTAQGVYQLCQEPGGAWMFAID